MRKKKRKRQKGTLLKKKKSGEWDCYCFGKIQNNSKDATMISHIGGDTLEKMYLIFCRFYRGKDREMVIILKIQYEGRDNDMTMIIVMMEMMIFTMKMTVRNVITGSNQITFGRHRHGFVATSSDLLDCSKHRCP